MAPRASIHVLGDNGYVWDAEVAHWLRLECGLVGAMVGGVAAFKQQNAVRGLPLELSAEEVALALERGWAELQPALGMVEALAALRAAAPGGGAGGGSRKRGRYGDGGDGSWDDDYEEEGDGDGGQQQGAAGAAEEEAEEPTWRAALAGGISFVVPTTQAEAAASNGAAGSQQQQQDSSASAAAVQWTFPATEAERHRYWVFRDLHAKGYRLTGGSKFGADYLLYPGDPTLYHAQFCLRLLPFTQPVVPAVLAAATRGSHQARKHLLIASVVEEAEARLDEQQQQQQPAQGGGGNGNGATAQSGSCQGQGGSEEAAAGAGPGPIEMHKQQQEGLDAQRLGASSGGTGSRGERYRIHYMTIGPVEGFG